MGFNLHAAGTSDPKEVRNWKIHLIAIVASMSAIASKSAHKMRVFIYGIGANLGSGLRYFSHWGNFGSGLLPP